MIHEVANVSFSHLACEDQAAVVVHWAASPLGTLFTCLFVYLFTCLPVVCFHVSPRGISIRERRGSEAEAAGK